MWQVVKINRTIRLMKMLIRIYRAGLDKYSHVKNVVAEDFVWGIVGSI